MVPAPTAAHLQSISQHFGHWYPYSTLITWNFVTGKAGCTLQLRGLSDTPAQRQDMDCARTVWIKRTGEGQRSGKRTGSRRPASLRSAIVQHLLRLREEQRLVPGAVPVVQHLRAAQKRGPIITNSVSNFPLELNLDIWP